MKDNRIIKVAVLNYANEVAKKLSLINYLLENVNDFKQYSTLLENVDDTEVFKEIFGFGKKTPPSILVKDEQAVIKSLKDKINAGMKQLPALSKATIDDPITLGTALERMVDIVKDVKEASDSFERMFDSLDSSAQEEVQNQLPELMKAKMGLIGMVAFKLTELREEAQAALQKLTQLVPSSQLHHALKLAQSGYKPSLPMRSAIDVISGRDLPGVSGNPMGMPGAMRLREVEDSTELPWQKAEPEGK